MSQTLTKERTIGYSHTHFNRCHRNHTKINLLCSENAIIMFQMQFVLYYYMNKFKHM